MDPPLCGSTSMSHNECTISEPIEPQEASPMKQERHVLGIDIAKRVFHAVGMDGSCPCRLRINLPGSPVDCHRGKKAWTRALSWPPSGPLSPGDALAAGPPDTRHRLRSPPFALSHHHSLLASAAASVWLSRCPWSVRVGATADVRWHGANSNCSTPDTTPAAAATPPRPYTAC